MLSTQEAIDLARSFMLSRDEFDVAKRLIDLQAEAEQKGFKDAAIVMGIAL